MPFKKCNPKEELAKRCEEDIEINKYINDFNRDYEERKNKKVNKIIK